MMQIRRQIGIFYLVLWLTGVTLNAQQEETAPLVTDRPDATEAPTVVPPGSLQVETGAFYTSYTADEVTQEVWGYNTTLLRYGILPNLELRLGWNIEEGRDTFDDSQVVNRSSGFSPLLTGVKIGIAAEKGWLPEIGFIGHLFLPVTASSDYKPETTGTDFRFAFNHTLSEKTGIAYNLGAQFFEDSPGATYIYTVAYGYSFTDTFGAYVELYGDFPENAKANHLWDAGLTYLMNPLLQFDATVGTSFTSGQDLLVSVGLSFRIDRTN